MQFLLYVYNSFFPNIFYKWAQKILYFQEALYQHGYSQKLFFTKPPYCGYTGKNK